MGDRVGNEEKKGAKGDMEAKDPYKIQTFGWRMATDSPPTTSNLIRRGAQIHPCCFLCNQVGVSEDQEHLFWRCLKVKDLVKCRIFDQWRNHDCQDFGELLHQFAIETITGEYEFR